MEPRERAAFVSAYAKILTASWSDDAYAARLTSAPAAMLAEHGLEVPVGASINVTREVGGDPDLRAQVQMWEEGKTSGRYVLLLPAIPQIDARELSEAYLEAPGDDTSYCSCSCSPCCSCT
jgi:hypothetical protein